MKMSSMQLSCLVTLGLLLTLSCTDPPKPVAEKPVPVAPKPKPKPKPIQLAPMSPIVLEAGGKQTLDLKIERNGNKGPIQVEVEGMPEGVTVTPVEIADTESAGKLELAAVQSLGNEDLNASLTVVVKVGKLTSKQPLGVKVPKLKLPTFAAAKPILLQPGKSTSLNLAINRSGFQGPINLTVQGAPANVVTKVTAVTADQNQSELNVTIAANAPNGDHKLAVSTTLYGRIIKVDIPLKIEKLPFQANAFQVIKIAPGQKTTIEVPITRGSYKGDIQLKGMNLPKDIVIKEVKVSPDQTKAILEIEVSPAAEQRVHSSKVVGTAGGLTTTSPIVIRVASEDETYMPAALTATPELARLMRRGSIGGRLTTETKQALLDFYGGTAESEAAVMSGLKWLAAHQQEDGSWPLDKYSEGISECDCKTDFENAVAKDSQTAGTAFGVLAFLGAGVTHNRSPDSPAVLAEYQDVVKKGLVYLAQNQVHSKDSKDGYLGGNTYAHAIGTIALCEAYGLSGDEKLKPNAALAIKYLLNAQHEAGGGWRYAPKEAGDMSVTGWVFLAIRSAQLAGLPVLKAPLVRAERFIDSCGVGPEEYKLTRYGYTPDTDEKIALTAAGLLSRQYLGWAQDRPDLLAGSSYLMENLPPESGASVGKIYYYYYATQVLHHMEGPNFDLWNHRMRELLIRTQEQSGHKAGSWNPQGVDYGNRAGRMYSTCMSIFTLQVYYRHLPMYRTVKRF